MKNFAEYVEKMYKATDGKGYICSPSGSHDEIRVSTFKSPDMVKVIFAFLLTYKNEAFIYYGDEIGIEHNFNVSKDGGSIRTGTRTPMQWTNGKNRGFSERRTTYLPTNNKTECSVESQKDDPNSILNTVKQLIKIRKKYPCLNAEAKQTFLETGYPAVYEREDAKDRIRVYLNPADKPVTRDCDFKEVIFSKNAEIKDGKITLNAQSFAILKM